MSNEIWPAVLSGALGTAIGMAFILIRQHIVRRRREAKRAWRPSKTVPLPENRNQQRTAASASRTPVRKMKAQIGVRRTLRR